MKNSLVFIILVSALYACSPTKIAEKKAQEAAELQEYLNSVPDSAQIMPLFQGGHDQNFGIWIRNNIQYPQKLFTDYIDGKFVALEGCVKAFFVVEADGSILKVQILESPNWELGDAVQRTIRSSPKWTPGVDKGKAVAVKFRIPIDFILPIEEKISLDRQREHSKNQQFNRMR